jgi:long-chain acyl-CoA synthetase
MDAAFCGLPYDAQMYDYLRAGFSARENAVAISYMGRKIKAKSLISDIDRWAAILRDKYGIGKGDTVAMNLPNIPDAIILFYAVNKCGAVANMLHPYLPVKTVATILEETQTKLFITLDTYYVANISVLSETYANAVMVARVSDYLPAFKSLVYGRSEPEIDDKKITYAYLRKSNSNLRGEKSAVSNRTAVYMHSAGTTGDAKTIVLSNSAVNALSDSLSYVIPNVNAEHDKCIMVLPLFHGFGFGVCMHAMLSHGFEVAVIPKFKPKKMAATVKKRKATLCAGVPIMFSRLMELPDRDFKKLRYLENIFVGGDKLGAQLKSKFDARLKKIGSSAELTEGYGLTETVTVCCINKKGETDGTSMGAPLKGIRLAVTGDGEKALGVFEKGEICVGGTTLMDGYLKDEDNSVFISINGEKFVKTGDIGFLDEEGKLHFVDRKKRIFKINGVIVFPNEIERVVKDKCDVEDCVAVYDDSAVKVYVQTADTDEKLKNEIIDACKEKLLPYAVPKYGNVFLLKKFPKTVIGKVDVKELSSICCRNL